MRNAASTSSTRETAAPFPALLRRSVQTTFGEAAPGCEAEVLAFLAARPIHTAIMSGLIRDNGIVSPLNRGRFYLSRNRQGALEGVALIGHVTLVETRSCAALEAFARTAQQVSHVHVFMAETEQAKLFWNHYRRGGQRARLLCRELLFEQRTPLETHPPVGGLRPATRAELPSVMEVQAQMAFEESGVNPLRVDPEGFRRRCVRRIEQGRVWVRVEDARLIFKADVIADTPEVNYIEGVWVDPQERGRGYGTRYMSQLGRKLLTKTKALTVLVNQRARRSHAFYRRIGYRLSSYYDTIYLRH
jgi:hypothetical protein